MNSFSIFFMEVFSLILFIIANWSTTTLFNGKGKLFEIFNMTMYSLVPVIIFGFVGIFISNIIILDEVILYMTFLAIGSIWSIFLIFVGLIVTHGYSLLKNLLTILITLVAAIIIVFVIILILSFVNQLYNFLYVLYQELMKR